MDNPEQQGTVNIQSYVAADDAGMRVTSTIVTGKTDALLVDAQFTRSDAHRLVAEILRRGKNLTAVYITHGHPDHYFGAQVIQAAFPKAKFVALPKTVDDIMQTHQQKIATWRGTLGIDAPEGVVIPDVLTEERIAFEGQNFEILASLQGDSSANTAVWIPSSRTLIAGDTVFADAHVWTAATTFDERMAWRKTLDRLETLQPANVVPGHCKVDTRMDASAIQFTREYLETFDRELPKAQNAAVLVTTMNALFPTAVLGIANEFGAKFNKGE
jgi:glyoxylase-like metal-dependent hydrolase (beta-lactamase superfamily II)